MKVIHKNSVYLILALSISGCSAKYHLPEISDVKDKIDELRIPVLVHKEEKKLEQFGVCMAPLIANLKPQLKNIVNIGVTKNSFIEGSSVLNDAIDDSGHHFLLENDLVKKILEHLLSENVFVTEQETTANNQHLKTFLGGLLHKERKVAESIENDAQVSAGFVKDYLTAYFKKSIENTASQVLSSSDEQAKLKTEIAKILNLKETDSKVQKISDTIDGKLTKYAQKISSKSTGFVAREGTAYAFPGVLNQQGNIQIDHSQVSADTLRIVLEAVRDSIAPLPVLEKTNAAQKLSGYVIKWEGQDKTLVDWQYDHFDKSKVLKISLDESTFQSIEAKARQAEVAVAGVVGKVIRGGSWGALNNEAVAKLVETATGVVARHVTERAEWCQLGLDNNTAENK